MRLTKYYRVDDYSKNFGTMLFICTDKPRYAGIISQEQAYKIYGGDYIQVTEFVAPSDIRNAKEAWEQGEIIETRYFMPQQPN
jgi:hypothetical protein